MLARDGHDLASLDGEFRFGRGDVDTWRPRLEGGSGHGGVESDDRRYIPSVLVAGGDLPGSLNHIRRMAHLVGLLCRGRGIDAQSELDGLSRPRSAQIRRVNHGDSVGQIPRLVDGLRRLRHRQSRDLQAPDVHTRKDHPRGHCVYVGRQGQGDDDGQERQQAARQPAKRIRLALEALRGRQRRSEIAYGGIQGWSRDFHDFLPGRSCRAGGVGPTNHACRAIRWLSAGDPCSLRGPDGAILLRVPATGCLLSPSPIPDATSLPEKVPNGIGAPSAEAIRAGVAGTDLAWLAFA